MDCSAQSASILLFLLGVAKKFGLCHSYMPCSHRKITCKQSFRDCNCVKLSFHKNNIDHQQKNQLKVKVKLQWRTKMHHLKKRKKLWKNHKNRQRKKQRKRPVTRRSKPLNNQQKRFVHWGLAELLQFCFVCKQCKIQLSFLVQIGILHLQKLAGCDFLCGTIWWWNHSSRSDSSILNLVLQMRHHQTLSVWNTSWWDEFRDRVVVGLLDQKLSEKLQLDSDLTLEKAINSTQQSEAICCWRK